MTEVFDYLRKKSQEKRADNRCKSATMLTAHGVKFEERNLGAHLIVTAGAKIVDFWPGTGKWVVRGPARSGNRGVAKLINYVKQQEAAEGNK